MRTIKTNHYRRHHIAYKSLMPTIERFAKPSPAKVTSRVSTRDASHLRLISRTNLNATSNSDAINEILQRHLLQTRSHQTLAHGHWESAVNSNFSFEYPRDIRICRHSSHESAGIFQCRRLTVKCHNGNSERKFCHFALKFWASTAPTSQ